MPELQKKSLATARQAIIFQLDIGRIPASRTALAAKKSGSQIEAPSIDYER